jgi:CRP-like cAMP-binding protein
MMPDLFEKIILLKKSDIFNEINTDDLRFVADALEEAEYFKGDQIFEKNDMGDCMYVVLNGVIGISLDANSENDEFITMVREGECFGEMSLVDDLPRSASAVVVEDAKVLMLSKFRLRGLMMSYPDLGMGMLKALSLKLRRATQLIS